MDQYSYYVSELLVRGRTRRHSAEARLSGGIWSLSPSAIPFLQEGLHRCKCFIIHGRNGKDGPDEKIDAHSNLRVVEQAMDKSVTKSEQTLDTVTSIRATPR